MIKHLVMFKLLDQENRISKINILKDKLDALKNKIPQVIRLETGINITQSQRAYDLVLITEFKTIEDLEIYRAHPDHILVLEYLEKVNDKIAVVDFNF
jgi:hypothetical protein